MALDKEKRLWCRNISAQLSCNRVAGNLAQAFDVVGHIGKELALNVKVDTRINILHDDGAINVNGEIAIKEGCLI